MCVLPYQVLCFAAGNPFFLRLVLVREPTSFIRQLVRGEHVGLSVLAHSSNTLLPLQSCTATSGHFAEHVTLELLLDHMRLEHQYQRAECTACFHSQSCFIHPAQGFTEAYASLLLLYFAAPHAYYPCRWSNLDWDPASFIQQLGIGERLNPVNQHFTFSLPPQRCPVTNTFSCQSCLVSSDFWTTRIHCINIGAEDKACFHGILLP